jgi:hypothetical protein
MKRILTAAAMTLVIAGSAMQPGSAAAQQIPLNARIKTDYDPTDKFPQLMERLRARKILELYSQFMSPLKLKYELKVTTVQCNEINADYNRKSDGKGGWLRFIRLCYDYIDFIENQVSVPHNDLPPKLKEMPNTGLTPGFTRAEVIVGGIAGVLLHETGHAVFDNLDIPRLGKEEDAADQIAAYVALQFGRTTALTMIKGIVNLRSHWRAVKTFNTYQMADTHSLDVQRLVNTLCTAYGSPQRATFQTLAKAWIPASRIDNCEAEYNLTKHAFDRTLLKDIDRTLMERVRNMDLLKPSDFPEFR